MSLIFDALQRSESERSGAKVSALSAATEVLRLAELQVEAERKAAAQCEPEATAGSWERNKVSAMEPAPPDGSAIGVEGIAALPMNGVDEHQAAFPQFESLKCEIPLEKRLVCVTDNNSLAAEKFRFLG